MAKRLNGLERVLRGFDDQPIIQTNLAGEPQGTISAGSLLAAICGRGSSPDPIRSIDIGLKVHHAKNYVDLDDADMELLEKAVTADRGSTDLAKAWLLKLLQEAKPRDSK